MDPEFEAGKSATREALVAALATAPAAYLDGALENGALGPDQVPVLLRNPAAGAAMLTRIADDPRLMDAYEVRRAVALHPSTPRLLAQRLLPHLRWRDLAAAADMQRLAPPLRRFAERQIAVRMEGLALGERVALARIASRGVIATLRRDESPMVIRALLRNRNLVEEDVLAITATRSAPGSVLEAIAADSRFGVRPAVQRAVVAHAETPRAVALRIVGLLSRRALQGLARDAKAPTLVRLAAERRLAERRGE